MLKSTNMLKKLTKKELIEALERQDDYFASIIAGLKLCKKCRINNKIYASKKND